MTNILKIFQNFLPTKKKHFIILILCSILSIPIIYKVIKYNSLISSHKDKTYINKPLMDLITALAEKEYVETPDLDKMKEGALSGMLLALDPYSTYINEENYKHFMDTTTGEFGGIGLEILYTDTGLRVISPIDDTPAAQAGLQPGDLITHLDNEPVTGKGYGPILKKIHGKPGTTLNLTFMRGDQSPLKIALTREIITINPVKLSMENSMLYIRLSYFNDKAAKILKKELMEYTEKNSAESPKIKGIILDLRNNPGGILDQAITISSLFLGEKEIVHVQSRDSSKNKIYKGTESAFLTGIPMITLINGGSASASEIVAAALQDHKRSILMGKRTLGKGSVQTLFPLKNLGAIRLTTAKFVSPHQNVIQNKGVTPDINVDTIDPILNANNSWNGGTIKRPQQNKIPSENDPQLQRAIDILHGFDLLKTTSSSADSVSWRS